MARSETSSNIIGGDVRKKSEIQRGPHCNTHHIDETRWNDDGLNGKSAQALTQLAKVAHCRAAWEDKLEILTVVVKGGMCRD